MGASISDFLGYSQISHIGLGLFLAFENQVLVIFLIWQPGLRGYYVLFIQDDD